MFVGLILAAVLATTTPGLSEAATVQIRPVAEAISRIKADIAAQPPAASDRERIIRLGRLDQAPRQAVARVDFSKIPPEEREAARKAVSAQIEAVDRSNLEALLKMLPSEGWFRKSVYGDEAAKAAFSIVQHSKPETLKRFLPALERMAAEGEVSGENVAKMFDRVAIAEGRPQRYGTQFKCVDGRWVTPPIEPGDVNNRRKAMGIPFSLEEGLAAAQKLPGC
jgi:hypothetical protein